MNDMKSKKNKTIDLSVEQGGEYLARCLKQGEYAENSIILGDCLESLKAVPKKSVDLLIVDPPYNLDKKFADKLFSRMSNEEYGEYTEKWIKAVLPLLKDTATVYVCCDWRSSGVISAVLGKYLHIRNRITWQREKGRGAAKNWKNGCEDIWFATVSDRYTFNLDAVKLRRRVLAPYKSDGEPKDWAEINGGKFRDTCPSNFWDDISVPYWSMPENTAHPTQKPEKLLAKLILASSNVGDTVLDPFAGSGSVCVVAKKLNRKFIGVEISEQFCVWAQLRLENAENDKSIQGYSDGVFWERNTNLYQRKYKNKPSEKEG